MPQIIIDVAQYVIQQFDTSNVLILEELYTETTSQADVIARAEELESLNPDVKTIWYFRSEITESVTLAGTVIEKTAQGARFFDIDGVEAVRAEINGQELLLVFLAENISTGSIIKFYDINDNFVAEFVA